MSIFGELEQFAADLYPYRWPITIGAVLVVAALVAFAYRLGWHRALWGHRLATTLIAVPLLAVAIPVGWYTLSPLWERSYLEEASPLAAVATDEGALPGAGVDVVPPTPTPPEPSADAADDATPPPPAPTPPVAPAETPAVPRVTHEGEFMGADDFHFGRGKALIIETAPGEYTLRFEDFSVRNGPDLFVYLSPSPDGFADGAVNLGGLKATDGAFNYEIPADVDVTQFESAIVWCRQFSVLFAAASLTEVE